MPVDLNSLPTFASDHLSLTSNFFNNRAQQSRYPNFSAHINTQSQISPGNSESFPKKVTPLVPPKKGCEPDPSLQKIECLSRKKLPILPRGFLENPLKRQGEKIEPRFSKKDDNIEQQDPRFTKHAKKLPERNSEAQIYGSIDACRFISPPKKDPNYEKEETSIILGSCCSIISEEPPSLTKQEKCSSPHLTQVFQRAISPQERLIDRLRQYPTLYNFYLGVNEEVRSRLGHGLRIEIVDNNPFQAYADTSRGIIGIRSDATEDGMLTSLLFELTNHFHASEFVDLYRRALTREIANGRTYAFKMEGIEHQGVKILRVLAKEAAPIQEERIALLGSLGTLYNNPNIDTYGTPNGFQHYWDHPGSQPHIQYYVDRFNQNARPRLD